MKLFYRYIYNSRLYNPMLELDEYIMLKETEKGYWIVPYYGNEYLGPVENYKYSKKFILKKSKKRFAYPTKEEALNNYILRTKKYIQILENNLKAAKIGYESAQVLTSKNNLNPLDDYERYILR